jgi:hypothetical protein
MEMECPGAYAAADDLQRCDTIKIVVPDFLSITRSRHRSARYNEESYNDWHCGDEGTRIARSRQLLGLGA